MSIDPVASTSTATPLEPVASTSIASTSTVETPIASTSTAEPMASTSTVETPTAKKPSYKPPNLSEEHLKAIVNVLISGECSNKAFQHTLSSIQQLSIVPSYKSVLLSELVTCAKHTSDTLFTELSELKTRVSASTGDIDPEVLKPFSTPSSNQTKLLRLYKTIDFIHKTRDEDLIKIYESLHVSSVWECLGSLLSEIGEDEKSISIVSVLLPAIESFMVISKPHIRKKPLKSGDLTTDAEKLFISFSEHHKKLLNTLVRTTPSLLNGSFGLLVHNPKILEFDNKRTYFTQQLHRKRQDSGTLNLNVRRAYVFEDSYHQMQGRPGNEVKSAKLAVKFHDEEGVDAGGVTREWFSVLARQMFNPDYALFKPSAADKVTYAPNRASWINPDHLSYFKFVGRIIGKAIYDGMLLDAYFTRAFYKAMLGIPVDWRDMEAVDPEYHKSLAWILENDITDILDLTFSTVVDDFGTEKVVDLIQDGRNVAVNEGNKNEYVRLITEQRLTEAIATQMTAFLSGFNEMIPRDLLQIFNEQELELLISGLPEIDVDDWRVNTEYGNYTVSSPQVVWFWRAVRGMDGEERAKLIQFVTGTSKVPLEGFGKLQGSHGVQKFQVCF